MTHTNTEAVSDERLAKMLEGLDDVTPGPWLWGARYIGVGDVMRGNYAPIAQTPDGMIAPDGEQWDANAAHIARCDPDTIRYLVTQELSRRSASNTGGVEVKGRQALAVYGEWAVDVATLGELGDLEARMTAVGLTLQDVGKWSNPPSPAAEAEPVAYSEAETWCRLTGKALDALDAISCWEVEQDDEDAAGQMAEFAEKATVEIRAAYPELTHPSSSVSAEVTVTDEMVELALRRWFGESWPNAVPGDLDGVFDDMRATLKASINGGRENG